MTTEEQYRRHGHDADDLAELASRLGDLARYLQQQDGVEDTLRGVVRAAVDTVPGARYAGVSVTEARKSMRTIAGSDELVGKVDQAQIDLGQGPCLDALYGKHVAVLPDMARERRWPRFASRAVELGVGSMLSFQLYVTDDALGALNLYSSDAHAFNDQSEQVGTLFAAHAAVAMADAQQIEGMTRAVSTRDLIGQAKGILIERHRITGDQAFAVLVRASQRTNTKLAHIAEYLVHSGELITEPRL
ncbi:GAF and ANTAR domain-containing protein [Saccharothrix sp. S26]|uniref:GAF and ANTAR domain-containing protein n=1 Tax=Saccharothrix sp. S26 TaxID=2907215 RepID=UPI001F3BF641|nr:GAF and ANTAR domain-containing protein [Saccharothrix sp. S26]MCE6995457.1 GAF and ANTAR domain-containing protein [Saccharothrix sp. S26]